MFGAQLKADECGRWLEHCRSRIQLPTERPIRNDGTRSRTTDHSRDHLIGLIMGSRLRGGGPWACLNDNLNPPEVWGSCFHASGHSVGGRLAHHTEETGILAVRMPSRFRIRGCAVFIE